MFFKKRLLIAFAFVLMCCACSRAEERGYIERMNMQRAAPALGQIVKEAQRMKWRIGAISMASHVLDQARSQALAQLDLRKRPQIVYYTVLRGGSLKDVANNFGIFHHEIVALNPGLRLETALGPGSMVVVYRRSAPSQSVGSTAHGSLQEGVPMPEGPGRILRTNRFKMWGTDYVIEHMDYVLKQWAKSYPKRDPIFVGNLSLRVGGDIEPHKTHEAGRSVDLGYPVKRSPSEALGWRRVSRENFDCVATWDLLKLLLSGQEIEEIFIDYEIQGYLFDCAQLALGAQAPHYTALLQYPKGAGVTRFIRHVKGHADHLHVSYRCDPADKGCKMQ